MTEQTSTDPFDNIPEAVTSPVVLDDHQKELVVWEGPTTFGEDGKQRDGEGKVFLDLQHPVGFEFVFKPSEKRSVQDAFKALADKANVDFAKGQTMSCTGPIGTVECEVFGVGETIHGMCSRAD